MSLTQACYKITIDGRTFQRGLTREQAEAQASMLCNGFERKRASDKRRIGCFEVKLDMEAVKEQDGLYNWAKQGGHGGRL